MYLYGYLFTACTGQNDDSIGASWPSLLLEGRVLTGAGTTSFSTVGGEVGAILVEGLISGTSPLSSPNESRVRPVAVSEPFSSR
jgi:hypothetical protein